MPIQLSWKFWLLSCVIFVAIRLRPARPASWFGLLNICALAILLGWQGLLLAVFLVGLIWCGASVVARQGDHALGKVAFWGTLSATIALLFAHKLLFEFAIDGGLGPRLTSAISVFETIAYSYLALRVWDALNAIQGGTRLLNPLALSGYLVPFFMLPAGPINVYQDHVAFDDLPNVPPPTASEMFDGVELIIVGLFAKFVLAEFVRLSVVGANGSWPTDSFGGSSLTFLYIYLDFAGYSGVALGVGRLLGVPTPRNFRLPFLSTSLTEFWTRWHISLGDWIKRNLYFPIQLAILRRTGGEYPYLAGAVGLVIGFTFAGLWHRFTLPFLAWGCMFGIVLAIEKYVRDRYWIPFVTRNPGFSKLAVWIGPIYVMVTVIAMLHVTAMAQMVGNDR
jgi:D-alanyl-lipoteichoic acid acyltransferase DltB (MBOAT superfamily)